MTADPNRVGRRERRKALARESLLDAARQLIAENGVAGVRIGDVTDRADLGFGTFYTYFDSKEALIEAVVVETLASLASSIGTAAVGSADPAKAASEAYRRFLRFASEQTQLARVLVELNRSETAFEDAVRPWAYETLERGRTTGQFMIDDIDLALISIAAAALAAIRAVLAGVVEAGPETESRGAEMMLRGLGLDPDSARSLSRAHMTPAASGPGTAADHPPGHQRAANSSP